jgi:Na+-driven multidrug efflux pump
MFLIIGGIMSGNMTDASGESELILAGFGLGELSVAILSLSVLHAFNRNIKRDFEEVYLRGDQKQMLILLYQQFLLDTVLFLLSLIPLVRIDKIYTFLNQEEAIIKYAEQFAIPLLPGVYFFTISSLFFDYAEVKRQRSHSILALIVGLVSLLTFNYLLVVMAGQQLRGVGMASSIGLFCQMLTIIALNWRNTFGAANIEVGFCETFTGLWARFVSSFNSCLLNLGSLWAFEFCLLIASYISAEAFASQVVLLQITIIFLAVPFALGTVANDLVSDSIDFYDA